MADNELSEARTWAMAAHLSTLCAYVGVPFGNIIAPLIIWMIKKDEFPFVDDQGKEALNSVNVPTTDNQSEPPRGSSARIRRSILFTFGIILFLCVAGVYWAMKDLQSKARAASCGNDVWELYQALKMYAEDHDGMMPAISETRGDLMMDPAEFYPEYLDNSCWVQCEYSPARRSPEVSDKNDDLGIAAFNDDSFCYLPWAIRSEEEGLAFIEAYRTLDLYERDEDLVVVIDGEQRVLPRIKLTNEALQEYGEDRKVPILIEWPGLNHRGGTVCYLDGTRSVVTLGSEFPMTDAFISGLRAIASLDHPVPE